MMVVNRQPGGEAQVLLEPELRRLARAYRAWMEQLLEAEKKPLLGIRIHQKLEQLKARIVNRMMVLNIPRDEANLKMNMIEDHMVNIVEREGVKESA